MPVGNVEAFYAAMEGGANAVYLGLKTFNARGRAANFNNYQLLLIINEAKRYNAKVYVTLNTVIKNKELNELLDTLWFLSLTKISAVIIQDWGTYYLLKKHFPKLVIHGSTQMAHHNSLGAIHAAKLGIERIILARELTLNELELIQKKSPIETEVFVHGALCYSFSGMCTFSSYLSGAGANRGLCAQPCRRFFSVNNEKTLAFSMKDNQLIDFIPQLTKFGVASLKIEGRLKSGEYVYTVARAYRMAIDNNSKLAEAKELLSFDMGRPKTQWFYAPKVSNAISENPNTGLLIGTVEKVTDSSILFSSLVQIQKGNRLRIRTQNDQEQLAFKVDAFKQLDHKYEIYTNTKGINIGNEIFIAALGNEKFPAKLKGSAKPINDKMPLNQKKKAIAALRVFEVKKKQQIFVRINNLEWLRKIRLEDIDHLILLLTKQELKEFRLNTPFIQKNKYKIWIELPQFISETDIDFYRTFIANAERKGYCNYSLSHLSQKELLSIKSNFITNENVYCYNDAASKFLYSQGAKWVIGSFENEFDNMLSGANRSQIIPLYYYPRLFYSRQPVKTTDTFFDDDKNMYNRHLKNGITVVVPKNPVSLFQYSTKLKAKGFNQFLIDLSFENPSQNLLNRLLQKLKKSEKEESGTTFNFKKGLK